MTIPPTRPRRVPRVLLVLVIAVLGAACGGESSPSKPTARTAPATDTTTPAVPPPTGAPPPTRVASVPRSIDPTGRVDVTKRLQHFLASVPSGHVIRFRKGARYRVEGTLFLRGRHGITIDGNGATIFATTRGNGDRSHWWIKGGAHIIFRNLKVRGANPDAGTGEDAYVRKLETQHGFRFEGVNGAELDHVDVRDVYGDFVYIGRGKDRVPARNVWVHDSTFSRNGRQGIAVTAATNVIIERNHLTDTRRSTIDLEPDARSALVSNVFVLDNTVGPGRLLFLASHGQGPVNNVVISGNRLLGHSLTIDAMAPGNTRRENWVVEGNTSDERAERRPLRFFGIDGLVVRDNTQAVASGEPAVVLTDVCGAHISGNDFGGAGVRDRTDPCAAPLTIPAAPAILDRRAGRG